MLPYEIILLIFSFTNLEDKCTLRFVSKYFTWKVIIPTFSAKDEKILINDSFYNQEKYNSLIINLLKNYKFLQRNQIKNVFIYLLQSLLKEKLLDEARIFCNKKDINIYNYFHLMVDNEKCTKEDVNAFSDLFDRSSYRFLNHINEIIISARKELLDGLLTDKIINHLTARVLFKITSEGTLEQIKRVLTNKKISGNFLAMNKSLSYSLKSNTEAFKLLLSHCKKFNKMRSRNIMMKAIDLENKEVVEFLLKSKQIDISPYCLKLALKRTRNEEIRKLLK